MQCYGSTRLSQLPQAAAPIDKPNPPNACPLYNSLLNASYGIVITAFGFSAFHLFEEHE